ncbi:MAG TPA: hypothetical protein VFD92_13815, partial [Candidatus Binatia bacterium]|nr:hypothetical protein [Candidatus Binatia bacterium]
MAPKKHWLGQIAFAAGAVALLLAIAAGSAHAAAVLTGCAEDLAGIGLTCSANDVLLANVGNVTVLDDGCAGPGDTVTFSATASVVLTTQQRYDVGIYIAADGGDALTGTCLVDILPITPRPPYVSLDPPGDLCGDIDGAHSPLTASLSSITVACTDPDRNGFLDLRYCLTWSQDQKHFCATPFEAVAGSPSKCNCDSVPIIEIPVPPGAIRVTKTANPAEVTEPGGPVTFTVRVFNTSSVTVTLRSLVDNVHGDLSGQGTCSVPRSIAAGATYTCSFTASVTGPGGSIETDVVAATATDPSSNQLTGSAEATVAIVDVPSQIRITKEASPSTVPPGGFVTFSIVVENLSLVDTVTIDSLTDTVYGDLNGLGTCSVPRILPPGATYACSFGEFIAGLSGETHTNVATASGTDDDGNPVSDDDPATVTILDVAPSIDVDKSATPDNLPEPGGPVTFDVTVRNTSANVVTITSLVDSVHGNLNGQGTCSVPQTIGPGVAYSCAFVATVTGNAGTVELDVVTASGVDDHGNPVGDADSATVTLTDVPSEIDVQKSASPGTLPVPGGPVTFGVTVKNLSAVDTVTITLLVDSIYGDLNGRGACSVPQTIPPGGSYSCSFVADVTGSCNAAETDVVAASGTDDDGNPVIDTAQTTVLLTDVPSTIDVTKTATPTSILEPGGVVSFAITIENPSAGAVTITSLSDTVYGDVSGKGTCSVPQTIPAGASYACAFSETVSGSAGTTHTDVVAASGTDACGQAVLDQDAETVNILRLPPEIDVVKAATPDHLPEPGGPVTFAFTIRNLSAVDAVTITSFTDTIYGNLDGRGTCSVPQTIAPSGSYSCSFPANVSGNAGDTETNVVTASGTDAHGNLVFDSDSEIVTITDLPSAMTVVKTANPTQVDEPGGVVTFDVDVRNQSVADAVTIHSLIDSIHGNLDGQGTCSVPQTISPGGSYSCSFQATITGHGGYTEVDVVTAKATDDDGESLTAADDATVVVRNVPAQIDVVKAADPTQIDAPGGPVAFTVRVSNTSTFDTVTIQSLVDDVYGN